MAKKNKSGPQLSWKDVFKESLPDLALLVRSKIFIRSIMLLGCLIVFLGGFKMNVDYRVAKARDLAMRVSPSGTPIDFTLSGRTITFEKQYRYENVYALPFELDSFDGISTNAKYFGVMVQGNTEAISAKLKAKFILFGTSKRGVILLKGKLPTSPISIVIRNQKQLSSADDAVTSLDDLEASDDAKTVGQITVGGKKLKVSTDMVATTVNPSAKNVKLATGLRFGGSKADLYQAVFGNKDVKTISKRKKAVAKSKKQLVTTLREYEDRLFDVDGLTDEQRTAVLKTDKIAISSNGNDADIQSINAILEDAKLDVLNESQTPNNDIDTMDADDLRNSLNNSVDIDQYGGTTEDGSDVVSELSNIRDTLMELNQQLDVADVMIKQVKSLVEEQGRRASISEQYIIIPKG